MMDLQTAIAHYLSLRKNLGYDYRVAGGLLRRFGDFALQHRQNHVTTALVLQWSASLRVAPGTSAKAVSVVRTFATWHVSDNPSTEIPPRRLMTGKTRRKRPFMHSDEQLMAVLEACRGLPSPKGSCGLTFATVFALIAATGMRVSEAVNLNQADVDLAAGLLTITRTKFKKARILPLHESTRRALAHYIRRRNALIANIRCPAFFLSEAGNRLTQNALQKGFAVASQRVGQRDVGARKRGHGPRIHDLRHRFAVQTMLDWYRCGKDVEREMPKLVTYLGHRGVADTHWYIEAVPELLELASKRVVTHARGQR